MQLHLQLRALAVLTGVHLVCVSIHSPLQNIIMIAALEEGFGALLPCPRFRIFYFTLLKSQVIFQYA